MQASTRPSRGAQADPRSLSGRDGLDDVSRLAEGL